MGGWQALIESDVLHARGRMLRLIRGFFQDQGVLEVTTPTLGSRGVTDVQIQNLTVAALGQTYYLQTSPEYAMKRLLASGSGPIYQICQAYRNSEMGPKHNLEFTLLEWYRPDFALDELMDEVGDLLAAIASELGIEGGHFTAMPRFDYKTLFDHRFGVNPHRASLQQLKSIAETQLDIDWQHMVEPYDEADTADYLDLLFSMVIEPQLIEPCMVFDFPACQVALATLEKNEGLEEHSGDTVAKRFEVYAGGLELANGYKELRDPVELESRMQRNNTLRSARGYAAIEPDQKLLAALPQMPECSGVAVGLDRLLMSLLGKNTLSEVITFTSDAI